MAVSIADTANVLGLMGIDAQCCGSCARVNVFPQLNDATTDVHMIVLVMAKIHIVQLGKIAEIRQGLQLLALS